MLTQVAEGVLVHQSEVLQNNTAVVQGREGVLLVDAGITGDEMACLATDLRELGQPVVAGFATHPDWDHVLWHSELGDAPRYGTARCAAFMQDLRSDADWRARVAEHLPPRSPTTHRWTCSASSPVCPTERRRSHGMAPRSGSSSIRRIPLAMRHC